MDEYLTTQIITYMGNKRKLLPTIKSIVESICEKENKSKLTIGDGFSGSGIVSRLFKSYSSVLYTNDIADYSFSLNNCFLSNITPTTEKKLKHYIEQANAYANNHTAFMEPFVSGKWAPLGKKIEQGERVYFTYENGKRIDIYRNYIETISEPYKSYLLGVLLTEVSIHNNTNGQFSAFYKDESSIGKYGGKHEIDLHRIEGLVTLKMPVFQNSSAEIHIDKKDTKEWAKEIPHLDLVYYDPPYNKHPYSIYYFLLNIVAIWDKTIPIPDTNRGQPLGWRRSAYNSFKHAETEFNDLIDNTKSKYILISYNNGGIIPINKMDAILGKYGKVEKIPVEHKTYNRLKGISNYKRQKEDIDVKEFFWLLEKK